MARLLRALYDSFRTPRQVFSDIYARNLWGGVYGELFSGPGSRFKAAEIYVSTIAKFIQQHQISSVADLGCGDFVIGKQIAAYCDSYCGVDVATNVVTAHSQLVSDKISFLARDITRDELPDADLCLIRQVLQHMSNRQIEKVLRQARKYKHLIVTEHQPNHPVEFNRDKVHGAGTRVDFDSGVFLDKPPFNASLTLLAEVSLEISGADGQPVTAPSWGKIRTFQVTI